MVYNWQEGTAVITRFIYHTPLNLEFNIITCVLAFPLQPPPYLLLFLLQNLFISVYPLYNNVNHFIPLFFKILQSN